MWYNAYITKFRDSDEGLWTVAIQRQDVAPATGPIEFIPGKQPLEWSGKSNGEQGEILLPTTGTLCLRITNETVGEISIGKLLPAKYNDRRVIVTRDNIVAWQGFLLPETYDQDWVAPDFEIELSICDTVSSLQYVFLEGNESATNIIQLLYSAYKRVGGDLSISDFLVSDRQLYYARNGAPTSRRDHWGSGGFYPAYFASTEDGDKKSYKEIIEILLAPYGRLRQIGQRWYVGTDKATSTSLYMPNADGLGRLNGKRMVVVVVDMDKEVAGTRNTQSILPPPSKVTLKYEAEKGNVDYSGDDIFKIKSDIIISSYSSGYRDMSELRYLAVSPESLKWPVQLIRHTLVMPHFFSDRDGHIESNWTAWTLEDRTPWDCTGFSQVLENNGGWEVKNGLVFGQRRLIRDLTDWTFTLDVSADEFRLQKEVQTSDSFRLKLRMKSQRTNLNDRDSWSYPPFGEMQPYVQIYYGESQNSKSHVLVRNLFTGEWSWSQTYPPNQIWFNDSVRTSLFPVSWFESGANLRIPNDHGYLTFVVYAGQGGLSVVPREVAFHGDNLWQIDSHSILSEFELTYTEYNENAQTLLDWNKEIRSTVITQLPGGTEELELEYKTLANEAPTPETFLAPRRSFCDSSTAYISRPRQLLDIGAVSLNDYNLAGVAFPAIFRFGGEAYFPLSVGMDCRRNRAKLKLIKTL